MTKDELLKWLFEWQDFCSRRDICWKTIQDGFSCKINLDECNQAYEEICQLIRRQLEYEPTEEIKRLAHFIVAEVPGESSQSEGTVDAAIRIMREQCQLLKVLKEKEREASND